MKQRWCSSWLCVRPAMLLLCAVLTVSLCAAYPSENANGGGTTFTSGQLEFITLTQDCMEAVYIANTPDYEPRRGLLIVASATNLSVSSLDGKRICSVEELPNLPSLRLVTIGEFSFLQGTNTDDYHVPPETPQKLLKAMSLLAEELTSKDRMQNSKQIRLQVEKAIANLLQQPESLLFREAALAMGLDKGVHGYEYPGALRFYLLAMQVDQAYERNMSSHAGAGDPIHRSGGRVLNKKVGATTMRDFRQLGDGDDGDDDDDCLEECPPCPDEECLGMCGPGCKCWSFVCGDCCYHLGCYGHDLCCRDQFFSTKCLFPVSFACESTYYCIN